MSERALSALAIPQRGPARLVEAILEVGPDTLVCRGRVPASSPFASGGRAPAVVVLELGAQAAAVQHAMEATEGAAPPPGYLVAVRSASFSVGEVGTDVPLVATIRRTGQAGPLATYDVRVSGPGGAEILSATLSTHGGR